MEDHYFAADLIREIEIPEKGMVSRTLQNDEHSRTVLFGFAAGGGLRDHSAPMPVILHFLSGTVGAGAYTHMSAGLRHAIEARTPTVMLLVLIKAPPGAAA